MYTRSLLVITILAVFMLTASSQVVKKVSRKGVAPKTIKKTVPTTTYTIEQFAGKWQEMARYDRSTNRRVGFNDTLFYTFSGDNVSTRDGVNMSMKGKASIEPVNQLLAAADVFDIWSLKNDQAVLDDGDKYVHTLIKVKKFWYEDLPTTEVSLEKFTEPISINAGALKGKWLIYRRNAGPGAIANDAILIKLLNVTDIKDQNTAIGNVTWYQAERSEEIPCTIYIDGKNMRIVSERNTWSVNVYKADGTELVFGTEALMYFAKPVVSNNSH